MEVIPIEMLQSQTQQLVSSGPQSPRGSEFRIRHGKHQTKRMSLLKKAYHPQDTALVMLHEPSGRLKGSIDCTVISRPTSAHKP